MAQHPPAPRARRRGHAGARSVAPAALVLGLVIGGAPAAVPTPAVATFLTPGTGSPASVAPSGPDGDWQLPRPGPVQDHTDLPAEPWRPGHRGVDLPAVPGDTVRSPAPGTIAFTGRVGGKPVVVVRHGALRSTFEPAVAAGTVGDIVDRGEVVAVVVEDDRTHCGTGRCLHWGVRRGDRYLDPLLLVGLATPVVLLPQR